MALGAWYILAYIVIALIRVRYPFELEWMEGAVVDHVRRVLAGQKIYVAPSIDFVPFVYPPVYFYVSALAATILGVGFFPLRLLSFLASVGCFGIIFAIVRKESGSSKAGFLAVSLFAACFRAGGAWYDLARIDSLYLLLVLVAAYLVRFQASRLGSIMAMLLLATAFLTKQSAMLIALPILAYVALRSWREGVVAVMVFAAVAGASTWVLNRVHDGWYVYYVFTVPANIQRIDSVSVDFWRQDILGPLAIASAMSGGYLLTALARPRTTRLSFYSLVALGMIGSSWLSRLHAGAYDNDLIPAYAVISILFGLAVVELEAVWHSHGLRNFRVYTSALSLVQLFLLFYDPRQQVPTARSRETGNQLVSLMAAVPGDVFLPQHGYLPALAGKQTFAHSMAVYDITRAGNAADRDRLLNEFHQAVVDRKFGAVIVDRVDPWFSEDLARAYRRSGHLVSDAEIFWPVTGLRTRPEWIYLPR